MCVCVCVNGRCNVWCRLVIELEWWETMTAVCTSMWTAYTRVWQPVTFRPQSTEWLICMGRRHRRRSSIRQVLCLFVSDLRCTVDIMAFDTWERIAWLLGLSIHTETKAPSTPATIYKQHCRVLKSNNSFDKVGCFFDIVAFLATMPNKISSFRQIWNELNMFNLFWLCRKDEILR